MTPAQPATWPTRHAWIVLAGALVLLHVFLLGSRGLNEPDETRYANIALAMAKPGGDWWEPRMSGYGHYDKPPLVYWMTAGSFLAFGVNEWAARLPSLCGVLCALAGLGWAAYRLRGARVAWWAVLVGGTSAQIWVFARILSPDMLLTGWCALAVAAWAEGRGAEGRLESATGRAATTQKAEGRRQKAEGESEIAGQQAPLPDASTDGPATEIARNTQGNSWGWWLLSLGFWTLAWWTKATPALVPLLGLTVGVLLTGDRAGRRALRPWFMLPAVIALGSPWYLSMLHTYPELQGFFFGRELAGRLAGSVDGRHGAWWYYLPVSLWAWLPWWPVMLWAAWQARARWFAGSGREVLAAWTRRLGVEGWLVLTGLLILSLTSSKLHSYTLTLAPWVALLMARAVVAVAVSPGGNARTGWLAPAAGFALVACVGIATLPPRKESRLGMNSSLREVGRLLRQQGATRVDVDRYWPGLEFYLGEGIVHYVLRIDGSTSDSPAVPGRIERYHERDSDPGAPPDRFVDPDEWPALPPAAAVPLRADGNWWFVRFYKRPKPVFDRTLQDPDPARRPVKVKRIGDFDVYRMPETP